MRQWTQAVGGHWAVVFCSFVLSMIIIPATMSLLDGEAIDAVIMMIIANHLLAGVVSLFIPRLSKSSCAAIFSLSFLCAGCSMASAVRKKIEYHYYLPYDRFRDQLADPVPGSVSNLRFLTREEEIGTGLAFRFDIAPEDLDEIITRLKMRRVDPEDMLNPFDFFQHPYYIPLEGDYHLYQARVDSKGDVLTLKVNATHSHAIFRREWADFYPYDSTRSLLSILRHNRELMKMKKKHEAAGRQPKTTPQ